jgi:hypothetical protein
VLKLKQLFCLLAHDEPMLPIHGQVMCRRCQCVRPVEWDREDVRTAMVRSERVQEA